jgi:hypothetical protein
LVISVPFQQLNSDPHYRLHNGKHEDGWVLPGQAGRARNSVPTYMLAIPALCQTSIIDRIDHFWPNLAPIYQ